MVKHKVDQIEFYKLYMVKRLPKPDIMSHFHITEKTFYAHVKKVNECILNEVTFSSIEKEITKQYNTTLDKKIKLRLLETSVKLLAQKMKASNEEINPLLIDEDHQFKYSATPLVK